MFMLYILLAFAGMILLGGALGILDKLFFNGILGDWIGKRFDYKDFLPIESSADMDSPFLLFMAFPIILMFKLVAYPCFLILKVHTWYKEKPEDESGISVQEKMFRNKKDKPPL